MNKRDISLIQKLASISYLTFSSKDKKLIKSESEIKDMINESFIKNIDECIKKNFKDVDESEVALRNKLINESYDFGVSHPFRNLWGANGQVVTVSKNIATRIQYSENKHKIDVKRIEDVETAEFWSGNKLGKISYEFNENVIKGLAYIQDENCIQIVNEKIFTSWVENLCVKYRIGFVDPATSLLDIIAKGATLWSNEGFFSGKKLQHFSPLETKKTTACLRIYYGPPGTGKTNKAKNEHIQKISLKENSCIVQIHPSYSYEDLVEGIKPVTYFNGEIKYQVVEGPVRIMSKKANGEAAKILCCIYGNGVNFPLGTVQKYGFKNILVSVDNNFEGKKSVEINSDCIPSKDIFPNTEEKIDVEVAKYQMLYVKDESWSSEDQYVLLLDEINRGHVATILGELIFALSETQSEKKEPVKLQYSGDNFVWPLNLSLIGTMNTADTTTDKIDQAIKRRFEFIAVNPMMTQKEWDKEVKLSIINNEKISKAFKDSGLSNAFYPWVILSMINDALKCPEIRSQFGVIAVKEKLIGHSYFIKYAREFFERTNEESKFSKEELASQILKNILVKEVYPSMLNIFNNVEERFEEFKAQKLFDLESLIRVAPQSEDEQNSADDSEEDNADSEAA